MNLNAMEPSLVLMHRDGSLLSKETLAQQMNSVRHMGIARDGTIVTGAAFEKLAGKTVTISQKAGVDGRLFGSVTNADIAEALKSQGVEIVKAQVRLPNGPLKVVGEQTVAIALHHDVVVDVTVAVVGETD